MDGREIRSDRLRAIGWIGALLSFIACLAGGICVIHSVGFSSGNDKGLWVGIGLYFIGKAFFVGTTLLLMSERIHRVN